MRVAASARLGETPEPGSRHHKPTRRGCQAQIAALAPIAGALVVAVAPAIGALLGVLRGSFRRNRKDVS